MGFRFLKGDRVRTTVGLPGSGLSYSETTRAGARDNRAGMRVVAAILIVAFLLSFVFSFLR